MTEKKNLELFSSLMTKLKDEVKITRSKNYVIRIAKVQRKEDLVDLNYDHIPLFLLIGYDDKYIKGEDLFKNIKGLYGIDYFYIYYDTNIMCYKYRYSNSLGKDYNEGILFNTSIVDEEGNLNLNVTQLSILKSGVLEDFGKFIYHNQIEYPIEYRNEFYNFINDFYSLIIDLKIDDLKYDKDKVCDYLLKRNNDYYKSKYCVLEYLEKRYDINIEYFIGKYINKTNNNTFDNNLIMRYKEENARYMVSSFTHKAININNKWYLQIIKDQLNNTPLESFYISIGTSFEEFKENLNNTIRNYYRNFIFYDDIMSVYLLKEIYNRIIEIKNLSFMPILFSTNTKDRIYRIENTFYCDDNSINIIEPGREITIEKNEKRYMVTFKEKNSFIKKMHYTNSIDGIINIINNDSGALINYSTYENIRNNIYNELKDIVDNTLNFNAIFKDYYEFADDESYALRYINDIYDKKAKLFQDKDLNYALQNCNHYLDIEDKYGWLCNKLKRYSLSYHKSVNPDIVEKISEIDNFYQNDYNDEENNMEGSVQIEWHDRKTNEEKFPYFVGKIINSDLMVSTELFAYLNEDLKIEFYFRNDDEEAPTLLDEKYWDLVANEDIKNLMYNIFENYIFRKTIFEKIKFVPFIKSDGKIKEYYNSKEEALKDLENKLKERMK